MTELICKNCNEPLLAKPKIVKQEQNKPSGFRFGSETEPTPKEISITCSKCGTENIFDVDTSNKLNIHK